MNRKLDFFSCLQRWLMVFLFSTTLAMSATESSFYEKEQQLNQALTEHLKQETLSVPLSPNENSKIADLFAEIGTDAWAIFYYNRALQQLPNNPQLQERLQNLNAKIGLPTSFLAPSIPLFGFALLASLILISLSFYKAFKSLWKITYLCLGCLGALLCYQGVLYYSAPLKAFIVKPSGFYLQPDKSAPQMRAIPLMSGEEIGIIRQVQQAEWLEIIDSQNNKGYILFSDNVKLLT